MERSVPWRYIVYSSVPKMFDAAIHVRTHGVKKPFDKGHVFLVDRGDVQRSVPTGVQVLNMPWMVHHPLTQLGGREVTKGGVGGRGCPWFVGLLLILRWKEEWEGATSVAACSGRGEG